MAVDQDIKELEELVDTRRSLGEVPQLAEIRRALEKVLYKRFGYAVSGTLVYSHDGVFSIKVKSQGLLASLPYENDDNVRDATIMLFRTLYIDVFLALTPQIESIVAVQLALDKCRQSLCNMEKVRRHLKVKFAITHKDPSAPIASASKRDAPDDPQARQALERR